MESPNKTSGSGFEVTEVQSDSLETQPINLKATLDHMSENLNTVAKVLQNLVNGNMSTGRTENPATSQYGDMIIDQDIQANSKFEIGTTSPSKSLATSHVEYFQNPSEQSSSKLPTAKTRGKSP